MKTSFKVLGAIMGLGLVILVCLHLFLQYGLTKTMREVVLPRIKERTGIDVRVGRLSLNVPGGIIYLNELEVKNPEGFLLENLASIDRIRMEFDLISLLKQKPILLHNIEVENALVNIVRSQDGRFNLQELQPKPPPDRVPPAQDTPSDPAAAPSDQPVPPPEKKPEPLPEILIQGFSCDVVVRYLDFKLNQLDIALDLGVSGSNLSTLRDPAAGWGDLAIIGSLGNDHASFVTDLDIRLAPVSDPETPSFDLAGRIMEIDPRIMEEAYDKLGIRSAPFGLEPGIYCRQAVFTNSAIALHVRDIQFDERLSDHLGGMASIDELRFMVPVAGTLQAPTSDLESALKSALGGNTRTLLESFLKGAATKEAGLSEPPASMSDAAVEVLSVHVEEIGESEATRKAIKDLIDGKPSATNEPGPVSSDLLVDILGEQVEEIGEDEELKSELKNLGKWLFGK